MTDSSPPPIDPANAVFLDFDGTLAPLQDDPAAVRLDADLERDLLALAVRLGGALAVVSGRDLRDLSARTPAGLWRAGGHGLEVCGPGEPPALRPPQPPTGLAEAIDAAIADLDGVWMETKGPVVAVHYRQSPDAAAALAETLPAVAARFEGYDVQAGKMVYEAKPPRAHKGAALKALMEQPPFRGRTPVMAGDDVTDEDAFEAALALGGGAVKVGDGETLAPHRLAGPREVAQWLKTGLSA